MPNPNGSNDSINEIHNILSRCTEDLRFELRSRDERIANLQSEFATMAARANAAEEALAKSESFLTQINRTLREAGWVKGTYVESIKMLIDAARLVPELQKKLAEVVAKPRLLVERDLFDASQYELADAVRERDEAVKLLRTFLESHDNYVGSVDQVRSFLDGDAVIE